MSKINTTPSDNAAHLQKLLTALRPFAKLAEQFADNPLTDTIVRTDTDKLTVRHFINAARAVNNVAALANTLALSEGDLEPWHEAVLVECMRTEACYRDDDPAATLSALIDWHCHANASSRQTENVTTSPASATELVGINLPPLPKPRNKAGDFESWAGVYTEHEIARIRSDTIAACRPTSVVAIHQVRAKLTGMNLPAPSAWQDVDGKELEHARSQPDWYEIRVVYTIPYSEQASEQGARQ